MDQLSDKHRSALIDLAATALTLIMKRGMIMRRKRKRRRIALLSVFYTERTNASIRMRHLSFLENKIGLDAVTRHATFGIMHNIFRCIFPLIKREKHTTSFAQNIKKSENIFRTNLQLWHLIHMPWKVRPYIFTC